MKKKHRSTPAGGQDYYKRLMEECTQPEIEEERAPIRPFIIERDGKKLIYNGHMGTFVDYDGKSHE